MIDSVMQKELIKFLKFASKELGIQDIPKIVFSDKSIANKYKTFGLIDYKKKTIIVRVKGRHPIDIMRTIVDELTHYKDGYKNIDSTASEDRVNILSGRIMKKFKKYNSNSYNLRSIPEEVAANAMGDSSPSNPNSTIAMPEKKLPVKKKLKDILKRKE